MTVHPPSDHDLLAGGVEDLVTENAAAARRLGRLVEFHRRCGHRVVPEGHFGLTPVQETVVEVGELWGLSPGRVRSELQRARVLCETFPDVWQLCLDGALDTYRAGLVADAATGSLPEVAWPELADRIGPWLRARRRPPGGDTDLPDLVVCTVKQLRNKLTYETARLRPRDADERFRRAYDDRRATAHTQPLDGSAGDGTGALVLTSSVDRIQLADHRLTLAAKAVRVSGDGRTLEQLRTDLALGLILGTTRIGSDGDESAPGDWIVEVPAAAFARPVINVTVPIQTLMGVSDDPGCLSGGTVVPATLARMIAGHPGSTWHRMLTDEAGRCVEVSTRSYSPTATIWNDVVARWSTCFRAGCDRPAADCQLDHRVPFPAGPTSNLNLQPACERDHKAKHADGFGMGRDPQGRPTLRTRAGFQHLTTDTRQPVGASAVPDDLFGFQYTATEIVDALTHLAGLQHAQRSGPRSALVEEIWADAA